MNPLVPLRRLAAVLAVASASLPVQAQDAQFNFRFSSDSPPTNIKVQGFQRWAETVKDKSGGKVAIRIFPSAQLYNDVNAIPAVSAGTVDMAAPPSSLLTSVVPSSAVFELPSLWGISYADYRALVEGDFGRQLAREYETKLNVKVVGYFNIGSWIWASRAKPIAKPGDFGGQKIRLVGNPLVEQSLKALGAQPTQVAWPEVPTALLQGVIDGLETTLSGFDSVKGWELAKNLTFANHKFLPYVVIVNKRSWDRMPPDLQKTVVDAFEDARKWHDTEVDKLNEAALGRFRSNGVAVTVLSAAELKPFADAAAQAERTFLDTSGLQSQAALARKTVAR